ncbi:hypothetical protein [Oceanibium sediminis]|uniref:hypothetical protein n=1 Tax=Oceanibium sediminis TaxID=2026339 RepID=UPI000DD38BF0|nr:hypothetical protein [Oceanibium sediminis]
MLKTVACTLSMACLAAPALGLSCLPPNMGESYNRAAAADDVYLLVEGRFSTDAPLPAATPPEPKGGAGVPPDRTGAEAVLAFSGRHLGIDRDGDLEAEVSVSVNCLAVWCGSFPPLDTRVLAFVERTPEGDLRLAVDACPGQVLAAPTDRQINVLRACMANGACGSAELEALAGG